MPVEGATLTSDYGMRTHPVLGGRRAHKGIDLAGTDRHADLRHRRRHGRQGRMVLAATASTSSSSMAARWRPATRHLSRLNVAAGQQVSKGELIGFVGSTGRSTGPHLHYEVRIAGDAVNPMPYMQASEYQQAFAANGDPATGQGGRVSSHPIELRIGEDARQGRRQGMNIPPPFSCADGLRLPHGSLGPAKRRCLRTRGSTHRERSCTHRSTPAPRPTSPR